MLRDLIPPKARLWVYLGLVVLGVVGKVLDVPEAVEMATELGALLGLGLAAGNVDEARGRHAAGNVDEDDPRDDG